MGKVFSLPQLLLWTASAGFLGVFYMPPLRRHMLVTQNLSFPSGTAAAVVITSLHAAKSEGMHKARVLLLCMAAGCVYALMAFALPVRDAANDV